MLLYIHLDCFGWAWRTYPHHMRVYDWQPVLGICSQRFISNARQKRGCCEYQAVCLMGENWFTEPTTVGVFSATVTFHSTLSRNVLIIKWVSLVWKYNCKKPRKVNDTVSLLLRLPHISFSQTQWSHLSVSNMDSQNVSIQRRNICIHIMNYSTQSCGIKKQRLIN